MRYVALLLVCLSTLASAEISYRGSIDLKACKSQGVTDPETYNVEFRVDTKQASLSQPTEVRKVTHHCRGDVCRGTEDYEFDRCESTMRVSNLKFRIQASSPKGQLIAATESTESYNILVTAEPRKDGSCPSLRFTGNQAMYSLKSPVLAIGRTFQRELTIEAFAHTSWARVSGDAQRGYRLDGATIDDKVIFQWGHTRGTTEALYCSGIAQTERSEN